MVLDSLIQEVAHRFNLGGQATTLVRELLSWISGSPGGLSSFIDRFRRSGQTDLVSSWLGDGTPRSLTPTQLESALGSDVVSRLASNAGIPAGTATGALAFLVPELIRKLAPGGRIPSTSELLTQLSGFVERPAVPAANVSRPAYQPQQETSSNWWVWALPLLLLGGALLYWMNRETVGTVNPRLTVTNIDGNVKYSGVVRDESTRTAIVRALNSTFGENRVSGEITLDPNARRPGWLSRIGEYVGLLRTPGAELAWDGESVSVGGWLSAGDRQSLMEKLRGMLGAGAVIGTMGDRASETVAAARDSAQRALTSLSSGFTANSLVSALNLSIINFPTGSAAVPTDDEALLEKAASAIKAAPKGTKIEIAGHTDNVGDAASNLRLSESRAESVRHALMKHGVSPAMLLTKGYGDTKPVAGNESEYGRFRNRRIEYTLAP